MSTRILIDAEILNRLVHDLWFDSKRLKYNEKLRTVELELGPSRRRPDGELLLLIGEVVELSIEDQARIEIYQVSEVVLHPREILVRSSFPYQLAIRTDEHATLQVRAPTRG